MLFTLLEQALCDRGRETLQRTLYLRLRAAILQGTLAGGSRLPCSRAIAQRLKLSRNTVNGALEQLAMEGICCVAAGDIRRAFEVAG